MLKENHSDRRYIEGLIQNDSRVIEEIYAKMYPNVKKFVCANSGNEDDAFDVFQEGLIVILNLAQKPDFVIYSPFANLLGGIVVNLWRSQLRRRPGGAAQVTFDESWTLSEKDTAETELIAREENASLWKNFSRLTPRCQKILSLFYYDKKSMKEISEEMNFLNENVAKKEKCKCLNTLRENYNPEAL